MTVLLQTCRSAQTHSFFANGALSLLGCATLLDKHIGAYPTYKLSAIKSPSQLVWTALSPGTAHQLGRLPNSPCIKVSCWETEPTEMYNHGCTTQVCKQKVACAVWILCHEIAKQEMYASITKAVCRDDDGDLTVSLYWPYKNLPPDGKVSRLCYLAAMIPCNTKLACSIPNVDYCRHEQKMRSRAIQRRGHARYV